jgi:hypothetical protein
LGPHGQFLCNWRCPLYLLCMHRRNRFVQNMHALYKCAVMCHSVQYDVCYRRMQENLLTHRPPHTFLPGQATRAKTRCSPQHRNTATQPHVHTVATRNNDNGTPTLPHNPHTTQHTQTLDTGPWSASPLPPARCRPARRPPTDSLRRDSSPV